MARRVPLMAKKRLSTADKIGLLVETTRWTEEHGQLPDDPSARAQVIEQISQRVDEANRRSAHLSERGIPDV